MTCMSILPDSHARAPIYYFPESVHIPFSTALLSLVEARSNAALGGAAS